MAFSNKIVRAIIDARDAKQAYEYCLNINEHYDLRQVVLNSRDSQLALLWCLNIKNDDEDMKQVILSSTVFDCISHEDITLDMIEDFIIQNKDLDFAKWYNKAFIHPEIQEIVKIKDIF